MRTLTLFFLFFLEFASASQVTTIYISNVGSESSSGNGTIQNPFYDFSQASNTISTGLTQGPVNVVFFESNQSYVLSASFSGLDPNYPYDLTFTSLNYTYGELNCSSQPILEISSLNIEYPHLSLTFSGVQLTNSMDQDDSDFLSVSASMELNATFSGTCFSFFAQTDSSSFISLSSGNDFSINVLDAAFIAPKIEDNTVIFNIDASNSLGSGNIVFQNVTFNISSHMPVCNFYSSSFSLTFVEITVAGETSGLVMDNLFLTGSNACIEGELFQINSITSANFSNIQLQEFNASMLGYLFDIPQAQSLDISNLEISNAACGGCTLFYSEQIGNNISFESVTITNCTGIGLIGGNSYGGVMISQLLINNLKLHDPEELRGLVSMGYSPEVIFQNSEVRMLSSFPSQFFSVAGWTTVTLSNLTFSQLSCLSNEANCLLFDMLSSQQKETMTIQNISLENSAGFSLISAGNTNFLTVSDLNLANVTILGYNSAVQLISLSNIDSIRFQNTNFLDCNIAQATTLIAINATRSLNIDTFSSFNMNCSKLCTLFTMEETDINATVSIQNLNLTNFDGLLLWNSQKISSINFTNIALNDVTMNTSSHSDSSDSTSSSDSNDDFPFIAISDLTEAFFESIFITQSTLSGPLIGIRNVTNLTANGVNLANVTCAERHCSFFDIYGNTSANLNMISFVNCQEIILGNFENGYLMALTNLNLSNHIFKDSKSRTFFNWAQIGRGSFQFISLENINANEMTLLEIGDFDELSIGDLTLVNSTSHGLSSLISLSSSTDNSSLSSSLQELSIINSAGFVIGTVQFLSPMNFSNITISNSQITNLVLSLTMNWKSNNVANLTYIPITTFQVINTLIDNANILEITAPSIGDVSSNYIQPRLANITGLIVANNTINGATNCFQAEATLIQGATFSNNTWINSQNIYPHSNFYLVDSLFIDEIYNSSFLFNADPSTSLLTTGDSLYYIASLISGCTFQNLTHTGAYLFDSNSPFFFMIGNTLNNLTLIDSALLQTTGYVHSGNDTRSTSYEALLYSDFPIIQSILDSFFELCGSSCYFSQFVNNTFSQIIGSNSTILFLSYYQTATQYNMIEGNEMINLTGISSAISVTQTNSSIWILNNTFGNVYSSQALCSIQNLGLNFTMSNNVLNTINSSMVLSYMYTPEENITSVITISDNELMNGILNQAILMITSYQISLINISGNIMQNCSINIVPPTNQANAISITVSGSPSPTIASLTNNSLINIQMQNQYSNEGYYPTPTNNIIFIQIVGKFTIELSNLNLSNSYSNARYSAILTLYANTTILRNISLNNVTINNSTTYSIGVTANNVIMENMVISNCIITTSSLASTTQGFFYLQQAQINDNLMNITLSEMLFDSAQTRNAHYNYSDYIEIIVTCETGLYSKARTLTLRM